MPLIIDDSNYTDLIGDGTKVIVDGQVFLLSATPKPEDHDSRGYSKAFAAEVPTIPRSEWSARIQELTELKAHVSQSQEWDSDNQGSFPQCWASGTVAAASTCRVSMGLPYIRLSSMAVARPICGGRITGGYEGNAVDFLVKHGTCPVDLWGYTDNSKDRSGDPQVQAARLRFKAMEVYECSGFDEFATACLLKFPSTVSYNWWSHVVMLCDLVEIERGSFGFRIRNNWGTWGDNNEFGKSGYAIFREGKGTPSGGFAFRQMTASEK